MKYVIKSVQVKGFTRTRKGKMERVSPYSRAVNKFAENVKKLPTSLLEKLIPSTDPQAKWRDKFVIEELEQRQARKEMSEAKTEEQVKGALNKWGTALYKLPKTVGEPYDTKLAGQMVKEMWKENLQGISYERASELEGHDIPRRSASYFHFDKLTPQEQENTIRAYKNELVEAKKYQKAVLAETAKTYEEVRKRKKEGKSIGGDKWAILPSILRKRREAKRAVAIARNIISYIGNISDLSRKKIVGEPYAVKEHTEEEYKKYLDSLKGDERELELEKWKLRLGLESLKDKPDVGEPYSTKDLRHIELDVKPGTKRTKEWKIKEALQENSNTINSPKYLNDKIKKDINRDFHDDISTKYHIQLPIDEIFGILEKRGIVVLQEDNTKFEGFFLGENAQTYFPLAPVGSRSLHIGWPPQGKKDYADKENGDYNWLYTPFKNSVLTLGWYKMPSGKYEITTYIG